jgi:hypothetical protein
MQAFPVMVIRGIDPVVDQGNLDLVIGVVSDIVPERIDNSVREGAGSLKPRMFTTNDPVRRTSRGVEKCM